jgi:thiamine-phosphate pyrophosphorylase
MNCDKKWMPLYAVTDRAWLNGRTLEEVAEAALRGGATILQLREKDLDHDAFLREALGLKSLCGRYSVPLIVNDDVEIALESGADGVHIGQHDAPAAEVRRRIGPDMLLGVSAQTVEQALQAERDGADYLGVGAVFSTGTKPDADDVSYSALKAICEAVSIPVVAIGGIKRDNLGSLAGSGIDGVAVVSAIFAAPDPEAAARGLRETVRRELGV